MAYDEAPRRPGFFQRLFGFGMGRWGKEQKHYLFVLDKQHKKQLKHINKYFDRRMKKLGLADLQKGDPGYRYYERYLRQQERILEDIEEDYIKRRKMIMNDPSSGPYIVGE